MTATTAEAGAGKLKPEFRIDPMSYAANAVSLQQAAATAKQNHGGKVVKAETQNRGGRLVHHIRLVNNGRVKTVLIDAETGQELSP
ncbi:PepSY domain-containing protein [uncultured Amphritea sp.]|uniref:PepSY domain-containing protein n=1 Tax=uncultured Amphritea sp. TaxID=981605 RepID=UPI0026080A71|nr:PepSY domain-containing protein [uncultured Amphritea sp.]